MIDYQLAMTNDQLLMLMVLDIIMNMIMMAKIMMMIMMLTINDDHTDGRNYDDNDDIYDNDGGGSGGVGDDIDDYVTISGQSILQCQPISKCSLVETTFLLLVTVSTVRLSPFPFLR